MEHLRVIIPFVLYHGASEWNAGQRFSELFNLDEEHASLKRYVPDSQTLVFDLSKPAEEELGGAQGVKGLLSLLKHIVQHDLRERLPRIFSLLAEQNNDEQAWEQISAAAQYLKQSEAATETEILEAIEEAEGEIMETFLDRMERDWIRKGRQEGWKKGVREGRKAKALEMTLRLLKLKVRELDESTLETVRSLSLPQIERLSERLLGFETQDDLMRWLRRSAAATRRRK